MKRNHFYLLLFLFLAAGCRKISETSPALVERHTLPNDANIMNTEKSGFPVLTVSTVAGTGIDFNEYDGFARHAEMNMPFGLTVDAGNNIIMADLSNNAIRSLSPSLTLSTIAGNGIDGLVNGPALYSKFYIPYDVKINSAGDKIVCDYGNSCIRRITPAGNVSTLAGNGYGFTDGPVSIATFRNPTSIAFDPSGNMIVCDHNNNAIRKITPLGMVSTVAGSGGYGHNDGPGTSATFYLPNCVAVDNAGNIYVTDGTANHCIRKIDAATNYVSTIAGGPFIVGYQDGPCSTAQFFGPHGILVDPMQNLIIADAGNSAIRKIDLSTNMVSTIAGSPYNTGYQDGPVSTAQFYMCQDIAFDNSGDLIIAEPVYPRIRKLSGGFVTTLSGNGHAGFQDGDAAGPLATFYVPFDMGVDDNNNIFVADYQFRQISFSGVVTTLNQLTSPYYINWGTARGQNGDKIVTKQTCVFRVSPAGVATLIAGSQTTFGNVDANGAAARFGDIRGLVMDAAGNIYVADYGNYTVRKIDIYNNVTTYAGQAGSPGFVDGYGSAARFYSPWGLDIDANQNIYLADEHKIRKIDPSGYVSTLLNTNANIMDMANDGQGNFVFTSWSPSSTVSYVKKLSSSGVVTTLAGSATQGYLDGPANIAQFQSLYGITIDQKRNIIVADPYNGMIRKVSGNW